MAIKNIIWDFDGTLFDTYGAIVRAFSSILKKEYSLSINANRIYELVKVDTKYCAEILATENNINQKELLVAARETYFNIETAGQCPFNNAREVCDLIEQVGGNNFLITHRDSKSLNAMLVAHEFTSVFKEIVSSDDGFVEKPSPDSFNYIINNYNLEIDRTCGVGDRGLDVLAANA